MTFLAFFYGEHSVGKRGKIFINFPSTKAGTRFDNEVCGISIRAGLLYYDVAHEITFKFYLLLIF